MRRAYIFCEGKRTEPDYFSGFNGLLRGSGLRVVVSGEGLEPKRLHEKALSRFNRARREKNSFSKQDTYWLVFDQDDHASFFYAIDACKDGKISCAYSIPCFEYWLILHFDDFSSTSGRATFQKKLEEICKSYDSKGSKGIVFEDFQSGMPNAINRAKKARASRRDEGNQYGCPSTTVDVLVGKLLAAAK
ncbi:MAG: RloB domain-containing protein [Oricola sp.]|nr:MAG: RloB domain-containing protein [Oricola sp.]